MILPDGREYAAGQVRAALRRELGEESPLIQEQAENLIAIAVFYRIQIEELLTWISVRFPDKQWSAAEFRRWCKVYCETRERLIAMQEQAQTWKLCSSCLERVAQLVGDQWWCDQCGMLYFEYPRQSLTTTTIQ